jgi:sulfatase maturation enzyme AslB (radical SAM superfamily)
MPCCTWKGPISDLSINDFLTSPDMDRMRQRMIAHDPPQGCIDCLQAAQLGIYSNRDDSWNAYENMCGHTEFNDIPKLEFIELNFSNICNLKCRMCDNMRSSKWTADAEHMGFPVYGKLENDVVISDDTMINLRFIRFLGGEPLLHTNQIRAMLESAQRLGTISTLHIGITTNGTIWPDQLLLDLLDLCAMVYWTVSIDAFGKLNDYIRSGSNWADISRNLQLLQQKANDSANWLPCIGSTVSIYNANLMQELTDWMDSRHPSFLHHHHWYPCNAPEYLSCHRLPEDYLRALADRLENIAKTAVQQRRDTWWLPMAAYLRQSATAGIVKERYDKPGPYSGNSRQLIERLDGLRGDYLADINAEIYEQLQRNVK